MALLLARSKQLWGFAGDLGKYSDGIEDLGIGDWCKSGKYKFVIFDTETNGSSVQRVIELAAYAVESGEKFTTLVNCDCEVCDA